MHYPPIPQRKSCNCEDPCISTDDVYYAGPNLPNSGVNTNDILTEVIEKLDAIYAVPTLQRVTEMDNYTTLPIFADSFVKIGGDGTNLLLDDGTVLPIGNLPASVTETSQLINDGEDGINPFITALDIPAFNPSDYDLDEFTNNGIDPFAHISDIPASILSALPFTTDHLSATNNQYVIGDIVWYLGNIYRCIANNDSILPTSTSYWTNIGAGYPIVQQPTDWNSSSGNNQILNKPTIPPPLGYTPVNKAGDIMLGSLILNQDPTVALGAATKQYVDNISAGIYFHLPVYTATTGNLSANYTNGTAGVGAKLTATANGAIQVDGESPAYLDRILVWQQSNAIQNGIYDVTVVGDSSTPFELTRSTDSDNNPTGEIRYGDYTLILSGDTNGGKGFICNTIGTVVVGTTQITYIQYNVAQAVSPGYGLQSPSTNIIAIDTAVTQEKINLTTTGTGSASLIGNTLNIPDSTNYWTKTGNNIQNNNTEEVNIILNSSNKKFNIKDSSLTTNFSINSIGQAIGRQLTIQSPTSLHKTVVDSTSIRCTNYAGNQAWFISDTGPSQGGMAIGVASIYFEMREAGPKYISVNNKIEYAADYSSLYVDRSLVDKAYVNSSITNSNYWTKVGNNIYNNTGGTVLARGIAGGYYEDAFKGQFLQAGSWTDGFRVQNGGNFYYKYGYGDYSSAKTFGNASGSVQMSTTSNNAFISNVRIKYLTDLSATYDDRTLVDKAYVDSKKPYKVYTALLTRSGTTVNDPTILENTIGAITFNYGGVGLYSMNSVGLFTANKTVVFIQQQSDGPYANNLGVSTTTTSNISIVQSTASGTNNTNWVYPVSIEIRVYN